MIVKTTALLLGAVFMTAASYADMATDFQEILDDHWQHGLKNSPRFATSLGLKGYADKLTKGSLKDLAAGNEYNLATLKRLSKIDSSKLDADDLINFKLFKRARDMQKEAYDFKSYLFPINNRSGWHMSFASAPGNASFRKEQDYVDYIIRLKAYPRYNQERLEILALAIKEGYVHACAPMQGYEKSISAHIVTDVTKSNFYKPFEKFPKFISDQRKAELNKEGRSVIMKIVMPAYQRMYDFYTKEYAPKCMKKVGARQWPNGKAYYEHRVRNYTTTDMTPKEVHDKGLSEVARIRQEMMEVISEVKFKGGFKAFLKYLRTDPKFYPKTKEELVAYVSRIAKKMDGQMPKLFGRLPRLPYGIKEIPADIAPKTTVAYYGGGSPDGTRAGFYFINTSKLDARPLYTMEALTLHEAVPGHHMQIALKNETDLPNFRRYGGYTVFSEGWGLYSERLGLEVGFYKDPYSNFGRLSYEMWRACRLVVDTGMHYLGWTRQKAIDFMSENTALSIHNITAEIDRYITWPGQALAYKTGELKIREIRAKAEKALGKDFDVRAFHDELLRHGSVPIGTLEEIMDIWLKTQIK
jgi:uncharacterized protein (DUF885 family)